MSVNPAPEPTSEAIAPAVVRQAVVRQAVVRQRASRWPARPDPGDLSRRLTARRAELQLSLSQVAARARVSLRYLEFLENFPGRPDAGTLRRLAAALCTTPAALLGAGSEASPGRTPGPVGELEPIFPAECRRLLEPGGLGRLAFGTASGPIVLPVNYVWVAGTIVLRTAAGSLIGAHGEDPVAFETDHIDETLRWGWSILVRGQAHRVLQRGELQNLREVCDLRPWPAGERDLFVRIVPTHISGRRIQAP